MAKNVAKFALGGLVAVMAVAGLTGCSKFSEPFRDAPTNGTFDGPAKIITMPDGFSNGAFKCVGPNGFYSVYHGDSAYGSIFVVPNDPNCKQQ